MIGDSWGIDLVQALAVPVTVLVAVLVLHRPIGVFLENIGGRLSKLSIGKLSIELSAATELRPAWRVDMGNNSFDVRQLSPADVFDSYADSLLRQLEDPTPLDYVTVDLGVGQSWLSSRLFLFAHLLGRMRGIRAFVFVHTVGSHERCFLGIASPSDIRGLLAKEHPVLEQALIIGYSQTFPSAVPLTGQVAPIIVSNHGALERWRAGQVARTFLQAIQSPAKQPKDEWVLLKPPPRQRAIYERATWLTGSDIQRILEPALTRGVIEERDSDDIDRAAQATKIVGLDGEFVAVVRNQTFDRLIDRRELVEKVARATARASEV